MADDLKSAVSRFALSDVEFLNLTKIIENRTGLSFSAEKQREFQLKLEKLPVSSIPASPAELIDAARLSDEVLQRLVNVLTVGESYFFRNRPHFNALLNQVFPALIREGEKKKSLNIWCAGCSTGEEPYSIAMMIRDAFPHIKDWDVTLTATDINTDFLTRARAGIFRKWSFRGVDDQVIRRHFHQNAQGDYQIHDNIKRSVAFKHFNLHDLQDGARPISGNLDLLLCRNVLIYFPFQVADQIVEGFREMIRPGGFLFLGHSEAFPSLGNFEATHSDATYYYRRYLKEPARRMSMAVPATASIPGFAVKTSILPPAYAQRSVSPFNAVNIVTRNEVLSSTDMLASARALADSGRTTDALSLLEKLSEGELRLDYRVHFLSALISDHAGYAGRASESLKRAIFLEKNFVVGHYYLGVICQREGEDGAAKRHFKNVLRLLDDLSPDVELEEAEGLTAGRLQEIVKSLFAEIVE
jgi:chemotaxis protein methyltransferase CheR